MSDLPVVIRELRQTDYPLILDSWVNTVRFYSPCYAWVPQKLCKSLYRAMVGNLLEARPDLFRVLVNEEDQDQIFGWICGDARVTHFVYIKHDFRDMGLASLLIDIKRKGNGWVFSHWTKDCERISGIIYKPSLFAEVIRGLEHASSNRVCTGEQAGKPLGNQCASAGDNSGKDSGHAAKEGRHAEAHDLAVGMVS